MKQKIVAIFKALLWCFVVLLFPIVSGTISIIMSLDSVTILFVQGAFMVLSLIPPVIYVLRGKCKWNEIGFALVSIKNCKKVLYFIPLLVIFVPVAVKGFYLESVWYFLGNLFLYLFVGISEEIYFRGIIPHFLKKEFSTKGVIICSTLVFGIGHISTALTGGSGLEIALTVLNALIFGWLAMETTIISSSIIPAIIMHFLFDFETKFVVISGSELLAAEIIRGFLMFIMASWFAMVIYRQRFKTKLKL